MRRRELIFLLGGVAVAWPLAVRAQKAMPVIGFLGTSSAPLESHYVEAFRQKLRQLGHVEGENLSIEYRWAEGQDDRLPELAAELARLHPAVIVTTGTPGTLAAKQASKTIPIVFASSADPVGGGLVASFARPGGNATGFTILDAELEAKRLQLFKDGIPALTRIAVLLNPKNPGTKSFLQATQAAANMSGLTLQPVIEVQEAADFEPAFAMISEAHPDALIVLADRSMLAHRARIIAFAAEKGLPVMYPYREYVDAGGLMSYAPSNIDLFSGAAVYVDKILKGAKPADLPVQQPTKFSLVINLKTAKALGIAVPQSLLVRADEVIE
ncbi:MAG TPA: ABC transporter substrate-binding protein [Terriglobales bacterium]|nr:ABC transporter substrate-binding protein [Terriglobales bacterium]